ncbi:MAG: hypothetical protein WC886_08870 [Saccharofermentanaceae bacterium]
MEDLKQSYIDKFGTPNGYGGLSGFLMALSLNMLSDMSLGSDYWIGKMQEKITELKGGQE